MGECSIDSIVGYCSLSFEEEEHLMYEGLKVFMLKTAGQYLTDEETLNLSEMLRRFRTRPADISYSSDICQVISDKNIFFHRNIPRKIMRKDEFSMLLYSISPYALLNRKQTAMMVKDAFPNFFSSVSTINSTFTKFSPPPGSSMGTMSSFGFPAFPQHTVRCVESFLMEIGKRINNNK